MIGYVGSLLRPRSMGLRFNRRTVVLLAFGSLRPARFRLRIRPRIGWPSGAAVDGRVGAGLK